MTEQPVEPAMLTVPKEWAGSPARVPVFPQVPLPAGTSIRTWIRAAGIAGLTVSDLLRENTRVQASCYEAAESLEMDDQAAAASLVREVKHKTDVLVGLHAPKPWETRAGVPTNPERWNLHVSAENTVTEALRHLQDNEVLECMRKLQLAQQQVFEVTVLDKTEQKVEGLS